MTEQRAVDQPRIDVAEREFHPNERFLKVLQALHESAAAKPKVVQAQLSALFSQHGA